MYFWYKLLTYLFYPFAPFFLFLRKLKKKEHSTRYKEKLSQINSLRGEGFLIWFHVASVGEAMSILPLIENFEQDRKIKRILIILFLHVSFILLWEAKLVDIFSF